MANIFSKMAKLKKLLEKLVANKLKFNITNVWDENRTQVGSFESI